MDRTKVAKLIANLDHPDTVHQREIMDVLVSGNEAVVDAIGASIGVYEQPRVLTALVQVLGEIGSSRALLSLMRFIFDQRDKIFAADARALAMKSIAQIAGPEDASRVFAFLQDMVDDRDPFVRGYAAQAMSKFGDRRALPYLEKLAADSDEFVRQKATAALQAIDEATTDALKQEVTDEELVELIAANRGTDQEFYVNELRSRGNAAKIAERMIARGAPTRFRGLQVLNEIGPTEDSASLLAAILIAPKAPESELALALRLFSKTLHGDAGETEIKALRRHVNSKDRYVRIAALEAAARSGAEDLQDLACDTIDAWGDFDSMLSAAKGLSASLNGQDRRLFPRLEQLFSRAQKGRLDQASEENIALEAYLVRAIRRVLADGALGAGRGQAIGLRALLDARDKRPLIITALELLDATTPDDGIPKASRWKRSLAFGLVDLADHPERTVRNRALDLLVRGASNGTVELVEPLSRMIFERDVDNLATRVVPLLELAGDNRALKLLQELAENGDTEEIRLASAASIRRIKDSGDYIDAEFE